MSHSPVEHPANVTPGHLWPGSLHNKSTIEDTKTVCGSEICQIYDIIAIDDCNNANETELNYDDGYAIMGYYDDARSTLMIRYWGEDVPILDRIIGIAYVEVEE